MKNARKLILLMVTFVFFALLFGSCEKKHEHDYGDWKTKKEATCTENGKMIRECDCGEEETSKIEAKGHQWIEANCESPKTCSACNASEGEALGHKWTNSTCTSATTCLICSKTEGEAKGHVWVEATCVVPKVCSQCGQNDGEAKGHSWAEATCETPKICTVCRLTEGEVSGHSWVNATCTAPKTCSVCAKTEGEAIAHNWMAATCLTAKTCSVCAKTEGDPLGHSWTAASCLVPKTCSVCSATEGEASGHTYTSETIEEASCQKSGTVRYTCSGCGNTYTEKYDFKTYTATEIYDRSKVFVGEVTTYDKNGQGLGIGSCFVITTDGGIITNYHVIEDAYYAMVALNGKEYEVEYVLAYDKDIDIALLKIDATGLTTAKVCMNAHNVGETVYALGSSKGLTLTFSDGIISYSDRVIDGVSYTQHDAPISGGNSGGPLINAYGEVIGINTWTVRDSQNLNFAINASELNNVAFCEPMTMQQFYHKESDVYSKMVDFIVESGNYYGDVGASGAYRIVMTDEYLEDIRVSTLAYYYDQEDIITLDIAINGGDIWVYIELDRNLDGVYYWNYSDTDGYEMYGDIYANTYDSNTLLGYSYCNAKTSSMTNSIRELASNMVDILCSWIEQDFSSIGVTAQDIGFLCY